MNSQDPEIVAEYIASFGPPICECGVEAPLRTSWTEDNPGRRFYGCRNYGTPQGRCSFFVWVDPKFPTQATNIINTLLRKIDRLEKQQSEMAKKDRIRVYSNAFVWGVAILAVGIPVMVSMLGRKEK